MASTPPLETVIPSIGKYLALSTGAIGLLVLGGWGFEQSSLTQLHPDWVSMKPNTATGFVLAGLALFLRHKNINSQGFYLFVACTLVLLGFFTLVQYIVDLDFGIDQILFSDVTATVNTSHPGRMSPASALCFLLFGISMASLRSPSNAYHLLFGTLPLVISLIALFGVIGYIYRVNQFHTIFNLTGIALHTALLFIALSFSLLSLDRKNVLMRLLTSEHAGGMIARRLLPLIVVLPLALGWLRLEGERLDWFDTATGSALFVLVTVVLLSVIVIQNAAIIDQQSSRLQEQSQLQESILASMGEGVAVVDRNFNFQIFNPAAQAMLGIGASTAPYSSWAHIYGVFHPKDRRPILPEEFPLARALNNIITSDEEYFIRNPQRPEGLYISVSARPVRNQAGEIIGAVSAFHDITEKRHSAELLTQSAALLNARNQEISIQNQQLVHASHLKSEFLANMSHELRTPLNAILGFSELLKDGFAGKMNEEQGRYVVEIFESAEHLLHLINDILDLSKIEAGMMQLDLAPIDVTQVIQNSLTIVKERAYQHQIKLSLELQALPDDFVADSRKLKQILYNLLSNAVKFTPDKGEVILSARTVNRAELHLNNPYMKVWTSPSKQAGSTNASEQEQAFLEIKVSDTGIGIEDDELPHLFQAFHQIDSSLARQYEGTGLGLKLVREMAELHGGCVGVASRIGVGSSFCVWLPLRLASSLSNPGGHDIDQTIKPDTASPIHTHNRNKHALVIEDNRQASALLRHHLEGVGFNVTCVTNTEDALDIVENIRPDLITLDLLLPGSDGWQVLERLKSDPILEQIPTVIISIAADQSQALILGAVKVIQKPLRRESLLATLSELNLIVAHPHIARKFTLLAVDDDPQVLRLIQNFLGNEPNCTLMLAHNGQEAIDCIHQALPDLLILDLMMPVMSGFDLIDLLKKNQQAHAIPILILTARDLNEVERSRLRGNIISIMEKSEFKREDFLAEVQRALTEIS